MMISILNRAVAGALAFVLTVGCQSGYAFQEEAAQQGAESEPARDGPKDRAEVFSAVKSFLDKSRSKRIELEKLEREYDRSLLSAVGKLLEAAAPEADEDAPKDGPDPASAAKSRVDKLQRAGTEIDARRRKYNEKLKSVLKDLEELNEQLKRAAGKTKPDADQPAAAADGKNRPRYLPTDRPVVVPSEDGHVVTVFPLPRWFPGPGGKTSDESKKMQTGAPKSVRLAEAGSPRLEVLPHFSRRPSGRFLIAPALRGEKVQQLAVFDPEITAGDGFSGILSRWVVQELPEPVTEATPVVGQGMFAYVLGNRIYTYRFSSGKWEVLELPEGARPSALAEGFAGLAVEYNGIIYSYNMPTGEWAEIDTRVVPEEEKPEE